jgi:hypothetical protein
MSARRFRWFPHDGGRHAILDELAVGDDGNTLCGLPITVPRDPPPRHPDGCWPTCAPCDLAWREFEGIRPFPSPRNAAENRPSRHNPLTNTARKRS